MLGILGSVAGLGAFVVWIMVLIKQFQTAGPVHGIIGIVTCGIWTFIWGWMNASKLMIKNLMLIWTGLWLLAMVLQGAGIAAMLSGMGSGGSM
jgi:hypothetical protein